MMISEIVKELSFNKLYIINMLGADDFNTANKLYEDIMYYQKAGVIEYQEIKTRTELDDFLKDQISQTSNGLRPIYHFESHGNETLSKIGDNDHITWEELSSQLSLINRDMDYSPVVFMACCHGFHAISAIKIHNATPFYYLFGPYRKISAGDLLSSAITFYKKLFTEPNIEDAIDDLPSDIRVYCAEIFFTQLRIRHLVNQHIGSNLQKHAARLAAQHCIENIFNPSRMSYEDALIFFIIQLNDMELLEEYYIKSARIFLGAEPAVSFSEIYRIAEQQYCSDQNS